jgi:Zn-dependent peptidase ImmA (M78 family)
MLAEFTREELAAGLDAVVDELFAESGVEAPPIDAFAIARALGLTVAWDDSQTGRACYVRLQSRRTSLPRGTILLRSDPRCERRQWAVAHEIGEHVAHRAFAVWGVDPRETVPNAREAVANALAGRILLPTPWFLHDARQADWDLLALKRRYPSASHELIARRMLECPPPVVITIFDRDQMTFRRGNFPGRTPPLSAAEKAAQQRAYEEGEPCRKKTDNCSISAWPVHEADWKREILRTEVDEEPAC